MTLTLEHFAKYKKVAILSTSNGLWRKNKDKLGLIYYSVNALKTEILKLAPDVEVDMLDRKADDELGLKCVYDVDKSQYDAMVMMNHTAAFFAGTLPKPFRDCMMFLNGYKGDVWWCYDTPAYFPSKTHVEIIRQYGKYAYKPYNAELSKMLDDSSFRASLDDADHRMMVISDIDLEDIPQPLADASDYSREVYDRISSTFYVKSNLAKHIGTLHKSVDDFSKKEFDICLAYNYDPYRFSLAKRYVDNEAFSVVSLRHPLGEGLKCKSALWPRILNIDAYYDFLDEKCYSSLIVTTRNHLKCLKPERFFGVFNSYCVGFIPVECDPEMKWVKNDELKSFSYVKSQEDLVKKTAQIHDKAFYDHIVELQRKEIA